MSIITLEEFYYKILLICLKLEESVISFKSRLVIFHIEISLES